MTEEDEICVLYLCVTLGLFSREVEENSCRKNLFIGWPDLPDQRDYGNIFRQEDPNVKLENPFGSYPRHFRFKAPVKRAEEFHQKIPPFIAAVLTRQKKKKKKEDREKGKENMVSAEILYCKPLAWDE